MPKLFVDIALPVAVDQLFTYNVPDILQKQIKVGVRIMAPFGKKKVTGFVVNISTSTNVPRLKDIVDVLDSEPLISTEMFKLAKWISEYYFAPLGEVLKTAVPQKSISESKKFISLKANIDDALLKTSGAPKQTQILSLLINKKEISASSIQKSLNTKSVHSLLNELVQKDIISVEEKLSVRSKPKYDKVIFVDEQAKQSWTEWLTENQNSKRLLKQILVLKYLIESPDGVSLPLIKIVKESKTSLSSINTLVSRGLVTITQREVKRSVSYELHESQQQNIILNEHQQNALSQIDNAICENKFHSFLLHGITGSGKTQIYIEAIKSALAKGKTAIVLVPEISLTPQIVARFQFHFGDKVAVFHSKMSAGERYDAWRLAKRGDCSIVIGPRSAIFAPLKNLGLIVVDEEQEASYKQFDQTPRYHARDVAVVRAMESNAVVVLGSATPSVESYYNALTNKYKLIELPERVDNAALPEIELVDMTSERQKIFERFREERKAEFVKEPVAARASKRKPEFSSISSLLKEKINDRLTKKEGIILLQNRRGFSPFVECLDCGYVEMCINCNVSLTYHITKKHLRCHYCGFVKAPPDVCPKCRSIELSYKGFGTQRIEEELQKMFPVAAISRMDLDTTAQKGSHDKILKQFASGEIDILLGTQMVAKGLDFSRVTLVGVISADIQMLLPDFRSAERTFQLLTQVAGRAGRTGALKGEVIIQTYQPKHYSLKHATTHDFVGFYNEEINYRQELSYPPFSRIALIEIKGINENEVTKHALKFSEHLKSNTPKAGGQLIILGPSEAAIPKLKNFYRWHILIKDLKSKDPSGRMLKDILTRTINSYNKSSLDKNRAVKVTIDVDPVGMM
jgi:primosomal protein N' (replication factor Y)